LQPLFFFFWLPFRSHAFSFFLLQKCSPSHPLAPPYLRCFFSPPPTFFTPLTASFFPVLASALILFAVTLIFALFLLAYRRGPFVFTIPPNGDRYSPPWSSLFSHTPCHCTLFHRYLPPPPILWPIFVYIISYPHLENQAHSLSPCYLIVIWSVSPPVEPLTLPRSRAFWFSVIRLASFFVHLVFCCSPSYEPSFPFFDCRLFFPTLLGADLLFWLLPRSIPRLMASCAPATIFARRSLCRDLSFSLPFFPLAKTPSIFPFFLQLFRLGFVWGYVPPALYFYRTVCVARALLPPPQ